jgi:hypothetical protein
MDIQEVKDIFQTIEDGRSETRGTLCGRKGAAHHTTDCLRGIEIKVNNDDYHLLGDDAVWLL